VFETTLARKTVTVLFADLVESTSLAESLDPEALSAVLNRYFAEMRSIVEAHGGSVEKFIGDAVVGFFGVPQVHEDDAVRATRAALAMLDALEGLNTGRQLPPGVELKARIGINTGEVAVTTGSDSVALGHAVSMAARLEQSAGVGDVLVGEQTSRLLAGFFELEQLEPLAVKGSSVAIGAWRVIGAQDSAPRGWNGGSTFVGRQRELEQISAAVDVATQDETCVSVTILAPPGLGKSRLAAESAARAEAARVLIGRCLPYGEGITYAPLVEMVRQLEAEDGTEALTAATAGEADADLVLARIRGTLADAPYGSPDETAWAFRRLFETLAQQRPLLVVIDDLHWAESLLLDLVEYVATFSVGAPVVLLLLARPELVDTRPSLFTPHARSTMIRLEPLSSDETDALLAANVPLLDREARDRIASAAGGIPLFAEQMAALGEERDGSVPATVRALLAARVDRLDSSEREVLQAASVEGELFHRDTVGVLRPQALDGLGSRLMSLVRSEFIRPERTVTGRDTFRFNHALIRDAVYDGMPRQLRAELHERFAAALADPGDGTGRNEVIGHHLERAYRELQAAGGVDRDRASEMAQRAGLALHAAGSQAVARKEWQRAIDLLERARELLAGDSGRQLAVVAELIKAFVWLPDLTSAEQLYLQGVADARATGDRTSELKVEMAWAHVESSRNRPGYPQRLDALAKAAIDHFTVLGDDRSLAEAWIIQAIAIANVDLDAKRLAFLRAKAHADRAQDEFAQIYLWDEIGYVLLSGSTPYSEVSAFMRSEIAWAEERGVAFTAADGHLGVAYCLYAAGDLPAARDSLARVRDLFANLPGKVTQHGETYMLMASVEAEDGNIEAALGYYKRAAELFRDIGNVSWWHGAVNGTVTVLVELGRPEEAAAALSELDTLSGPVSVGTAAGELTARARLAAAGGDHERTVALAEQAVDLLAESTALQSQGRRHEALAELLANQGAVERARTEYEIALDLYARKEFEIGRARVERRLAELSSGS